jgi:hypothetical protein
MRGKLAAVLMTAATAITLIGGATSASAATATATATNKATTTTKAAANDDFGCRSGYVCIIATDGTIVNDYYTYGAHNLAGKYGYYYVDNNQTGGASVTLCYGYNGGNCTGETIPAGYYDFVNLTPINSIRLNRP